MIVVSIILMIAIIAADQITKLLVSSNIEVGEVAATFSIGDFDIFSITHIRNDGAAWSILEGKTVFLIIIAVAAIAIALYIIIKGKIKSRLGIISLIMIISGGIGNLIDRIRYGEVVDFIKFEFMDFPIFNFADICVVIGAIFFCSWLIFSDRLKKKKKDEESVEKA